MAGRVDRADRQAMKADLGKFDFTRVSKERVVNQATKWRLPDGIPVIMMPGRLTRWKGHLILIDAIKELGHKNFSNIEILRHSLKEHDFVKKYIDKNTTSFIKQ